MLKNDDFQSGSLQNRCFQATFNPFYVAVEGPESRKTGLKILFLQKRMQAILAFLSKIIKIKERMNDIIQIF